MAREKTLEDRNRTVLGLIALGVVTVLIAAMLLINAMGLGYKDYTAQFSQGGALRPGNQITVAGIQVGRVTSMKLVGDHVDVGMKIKDDVRLGKETRAVIKVTSILGARYLQLEPAGDGSLENDNIDISRTEPPYDLQAALADVTHNYQDFDAKQLAKSLGILGTQLKTLPPVVPQAMENVHTLSSIIADRRDQLGSLLATTQTVTNTLRSQQANIGAMVNQGQQLVGEFVTRRAAFHAMMQSLTKLMTTLDDTVIGNRPQVEKLLADLDTLTGMLSQHDDLVRNILQVAPVALRGLANATGTGNTIDMNVSNGLLIDSWMCAISGRAKQFGMIQYFKDCK
ncbi:putative MCE family protein [Mycolicibacterium insubricum]|uniref:Mammalian cell entry protein n=1 Tax=Mycolicibacterium insubricum TaxID=444597 RepID=A0A1X0D3E4_9MYCO|nr:MCE family protein [Mycolicibacterium insubricum]MCB9439268.1 MCE family protein [Mycolicibacterium sp.]MCV7080418.1 MCE family protein [Mycolicibacterium insubricum]ORA66865.1 mammalian cell entry protein [Mycolicibacterium insubricum]BBZ64978.1 putative MCE family protein [Mycolicibacterium insubricum]